MRDALRHLNDFAYLQLHPLTHYLGPPTAGESPHTGKRLNQHVRDAITALQPEGTAQSSSPAQRRYELLTLRYVNFLEAPAVQRRLAISRSTYQREHALALEAICTLLRERWHLGNLQILPDSSAGAAPPSKGRLVQPATSFVGRQREVAAIERLLARSRLVTLTGPPGTGKTRVALEVARRQRAAGSAVRVVPLAAVREPGAVLPAIATALDLPERSNRPLLELLQDALSDQQLLLVLDNFEQVVAAAPMVTALLEAAPSLRVLATSRTPLHVYGEHDFLVPPLPLESSDDGASLRAGVPEAVQLFVERARAVDATFALSAANAGALAELCRRLDGLPLAIELAAARLRVLPLPALLTRLERRLPLLTGGPRDVPARQQTLRNAFDWSYDLLTPEEQALFRRLAVFVGGCTLEAVEAICLPDTPSDGVLASLSALVEHSLVQPEAPPDGAARYSMLESIREYARDRLDSSGEAVATAQRHAHFYLALAETAAVPYLGAEAAAQRQWATLEIEHDNLRAALAWFDDRHATAESLRLAGALAWFWLARSHWSEGRRWLDRVLTFPDAEAHSEALTLALQSAGTFALAQGDLPNAQQRLGRAVCMLREQDKPKSLAAALAALAAVHARTRGPEARREIEESLALFQAYGDLHGIAAAQLQLGAIHAAEGDYPRAEALLSTSRSYWLQAGDQTYVASADWRLGSIAMFQGDYPRARRHLEQSVAGYRAIGHLHHIARQGMGVALVRLGELADWDGDHSRAVILCQQALALARELGDADLTAWALTDLGRVARHQGNDEQADALFAEALLLRRDQGHHWGLTLCLWQLAEGALRRAEYERAVRLFAAAETQRASVGAPLPAGDLSGYDPSDVARHLAELRKTLLPAAFDDLWREGRTLSGAEAVAYALSTGWREAPVSAGAAEALRFEVPSTI